MNAKNLKTAIEIVRESTGKLQEAYSLLENMKGSNLHEDVCYDAMVKRFEVAFEYCWKMFKIAAEFQGAEAYGPRPAIQEALRFHWIDNPDFWAQALDARNGSVHDYFGITKKEYLNIIKKFLSETKTAIELIEEITGKPHHTPHKK